MKQWLTAKGLKKVLKMINYCYYFNIIKDKMI